METTQRPWYIPESPVTDRYDLDTCMAPYWLGDTVYNESVMVVRDEEERLQPIPLLYPATEILEVRSSDWKRLYRRGEDWDLKDGRLVIPEGSSVPIMTHAQYYPQTKVENEAFDMVGGGYVVFREGYYFYERQIAVTYRHTETWKGFTPLYKGNLLPRTLEKLENRKPLSLVLYGDSVMQGANSTGAENLPPHVPTLFNLFIQNLAARYGTDAISAVNTAEGGQTSEWGMKQAAQRVAAHQPDLVVINFGVNDGSNGDMDPLVYKYNMKGILGITRELCPQAEFLLISPCMPHPQVLFTHGSQEKYEGKLLELEEEGVAVAQVNSFHREILRRKRFSDISGNNVNHANDFTARMIAQVCSRAVIKTDGVSDYQAGSAPIAAPVRIIPK